MKGTEFSVQLLKMNLKFHKDRIKQLSKPIAKENDYLLKEHISYKEDLEKSIKLLEQ